jgi:hypothetical protein
MNWNQLQTILWLRWRLICNQWRRGGAALGAVVTFLVGALAVWLAALSFAGGVALGVFGLATQPPRVIMLVWLVITLVFLFVWMIGLLTELQRSETIDLQRLMHLPVALGQMFLINYLASHFAFSLMVSVPLMTGLGLGLAFRRGPEMILLIPLAWSMVVMVTAWTYCLRGWLATLMGNPRRRRAVIMFISLGFVVLAQGPNLYFNVLQRHDAQSRPGGRNVNLGNQQTLERLQEVQGFVPPLWLPVGAQALASGSPLPALLGTLGCAAIAGLGLLRAYRNTVRFYRGETGRKPAAAKAVSASAARATNGPRDRATTGFLECHLPLAPEQAAAVALATLRSLLRAPEVKMAWASSFIVTLILGGTFLVRSTGNVAEAWKPFIATGSVVFPVFFLAQFFGNQFGFDRDGFRSLMLSPADRRLILLGKNLAALPVGATFGLLLVVLTGFRLHLPPLTALATLVQLAGVLLMAAVAGNLLSILVPYRIQPGSMKPTKLPGLAMLVLMVCQMLFPTAMLPVFAGPTLELLWRHFDWPGANLVNLLASALLLGVMAALYWLTLPALGRLLQRRETKILAVITVEVE